jgi:hypothetical protein
MITEIADIPFFNITLKGIIHGFLSIWSENIRGTVREANSSTVI